MEPSQSYTPQNSKQTDNVQYTPEELISLQQEKWIVFCALGGLITSESDDAGLTQDVKQMTISQFSEAVGVSRKTLYNWKRSIPDFANRVRSARAEVFSLSRESVLFNRAYLIAITSKDHKAAGDMIKLLTGHYSSLELPVQRQVIKHGGDIRLSWADLVIRKKQEVLEGEIVNDTDVNSQ